MAKNPTFTQYDILICSESIQEYAQSLGFYEANITYEIVEEKATLNIKKNRQIKISSIDVEDEYKNIIGLKIDSFFNASDFTNSKKNIYKYLNEQGYPKAQLDAKAYVDIDEYKVDIVYKVEKIIFNILEK